MNKKDLLNLVDEMVTNKDKTAVNAVTVKNEIENLSASLEASLNKEKESADEVSRLKDTTLSLYLSTTRAKSKPVEETKPEPTPEQIYHDCFGKYFEKDGVKHE